METSHLMEMIAQIKRHFLTNFVSINSEFGEKIFKLSIYINKRTLLLNNFLLTVRKFKNPQNQPNTDKIRKR